MSHTASPSPVPSADSAAPPAPSASSSSSPTAASASSTQPSSSGQPAETFIPSHTRTWNKERRELFASYAADKEQSEITQLLDEHAASVSANAASAAGESAAATATAAAPLGPSCPPPSLPPSISSHCVSAVTASLSTPPAPGTPAAHSQLLQHGALAIIDFGRGRAWMSMDQQVASGQRTLKLARATAKVTNLVGQPYGNVWEIAQGSGGGGKRDPHGQLQRTSRKRGLGTALTDTSLDTSRTNAELYDTNQSQTLTTEEIIALKSDTSKTPQQLIEALVEGSKTFASKTEYSQEKYIAKKKIRHALELGVRPGNLSMVMETMWLKDARKLRGMRPDTVALMLQLGDVQAGRNYLAVDHCSGVVLASLLYRTMGLSYVIHAFEPNQKRTEAVRRFNFPPEVSKALLTVPLDRVLEGPPSVREWSKSIDKKETSSDVGDEQAKKESTENEMDTSDNNDQSATTDASLSTSPISTSSSTTSSTDLTPEYLLCDQQVDCIFIASKYDPHSLLMSLWPFLAPSGRFIVYDEVLEPLAAAHAKLSTVSASTTSGSGSEMAVNVHLQEAFFRQYQVLPNRTHPHVNMSASGGYILSGTKTAPTLAKQSSK